MRNRLKIEAVVNNARCAVELVESEGSLASYVWGFEPAERDHPLDRAALAKLSLTPESTALAKDLKRRGWRFVGPTTVYAFMQAMGLVNDHLDGCDAYGSVDRARAGFKRPGAALTAALRSFMSVDTPEQLEGLRRAGRVVAQTIAVVKAAVAPGISTGELDRIAADHLAQQGARSGPILTYGYPGSICISVDDQVVHGIPGERVLRSGELVTLDVAAELDGYHADAATTVAVGPVNWRKQRLMNATRAALSAGIEAAQPGATLYGCRRCDRERDAGPWLSRVP